MAAEVEKPSLKKFLFGSISSKIAIIFIVFILVLSLFISSITYLNAREVVIEEIESHLEIVAESREKHVETFIAIMHGRIIDFSSDGKIKDCLYDIKNNNENGCTADELSQTLIINKLPVFENAIEVATMNVEGIVVSSTFEDSIGQNHANMPHFIHGKNRAFVEDTLLTLHEKKQFLKLSAPVIRGSDFVGVIAVQFKSNELFKIITDRTGLGETGEIVLGRRDENGDAVFITPRRFGAEEDARDIIPKEELDIPITQALLKNEIIMHDRIDYRGMPVIAVARYIDVTDWGMVAKIDKTQAFAGLYWLQLQLAIASIAAIILAIFLSFGISRGISKPIKQLHNAAEEIEKGNFKARVDIKTGDELEDLGDAFNKTAEALGTLDKERKEMDKAKTEFLSITSHELRSPMTPMKAQVQMLLEEYFGKLNAKQKEALEIVLRNANRLDKIILDFLEISRIEAARLKFKFVKMSLTQPILSLSKEMKNFLPEKKIKIVTKLAKLPIIEVDPDRVMQVLRNLINNAKKFSKENTTITVSAEVKNNMIHISVADQGIGIKTENQQRIFEPFFQVEQTMYRRTGGTGLGLAICNGIVESQNGKIWMESAIGKGSTFYFTVPLKPVLEAKPIKLLFSPQAGVEKKIQEAFANTLGLVGISEFESLKNKGKLTKNDILKYVEWLEKQGILTKEKGGKFRSLIIRHLAAKEKQALRKWNMQGGANAKLLGKANKQA